MKTTGFPLAPTLRTKGRVPALSSVEWRDLVGMTTGEKAWELGLSLPWLVLSLWLYGRAWWQSFLTGPLFAVRLHTAAWNMANAAKRRWILVELIAIAGWMAFVTGMSGSAALNGHVAAMLLGECFTGFFAVWTVHHDCGPGFEAGRTQRNRWFNAVTYHMFLHREHHLFPAVPTGHLRQLAARLDRVDPVVPAQRVLFAGRTNQSNP